MPETYFYYKLRTKQIINVPESFSDDDIELFYIKDIDFFDIFTNFKPLTKTEHSNILFKFKNYILTVLRLVYPTNYNATIFAVILTTKIQPKSIINSLVSGLIPAFAFLDYSYLLFTDKMLHTYLNSSQSIKVLLRNIYRSNEFMICIIVLINDTNNLTHPKRHDFLQ